LFIQLNNAAESRLGGRVCREALGGRGWSEVIVSHQSLKAVVRWITPLLAMIVVATGSPSQASAKELASEAIMASIEAGTFDQIRQSMLMDMHVSQKFEFDEDGMEAVGRNLLERGRGTTAIEVLQLNQMVHGSSAAAANAQADAFLETDNPAAASMYYQHALEIDARNVHARDALAAMDTGDGTAAGSGLGDMGIDPEMLAAMGVTPEQMRQLEEGMAQLQQMQPGGGTAEPPKAARSMSSSSSRGTTPLPEAAHESEFCEVLHRYNAEKRISNSDLRGRVAGEYGQVGDGDRRRTWNVETTCGDFLVAVPLWADVSPPILSHTGEHSFQDSTGSTWVFRIGADGVATDVTMSSADGTVTEMKRLGNPKSYN